MHEAGGHIRKKMHAAKAIRQNQHYSYDAYRILLESRHVMRT